MRKFALTVVVLAAALPALAGGTLFPKYEAVRQGLLKGSLAEVKTSAKALAAEARSAKKPAVAAQADAVAKADSLEKARLAFSPLSDELIKLRGTSGPAVYYCSMEKKSWLQPKGKVGNPYAPEMQMCGELKAE